jgi:hypothetical protein
MLDLNMIESICHVYNYTSIYMVYTLYRVYIILGYLFSFSLQINRITVRYELPNPTGNLYIDNQLNNYYCTYNSA